MHLSLGKIRCIGLLLWAVLMLAACSSEIEDRITDEQLVLDYGLLQSLPEEPISFTDEVLPVLEKRCIVCHGCYDAPCQLKLSSIDGIRRGATPEKVYNAYRTKAMPPTRLGIDAKSVEEWRSRGFSPVLNESLDEAENPAEQNLEQSVLYQMLRLKQLRPQPRVGLLPETFDLSLDRSRPARRLILSPTSSPSTRNGACPMPCRISATTNIARSCNGLPRAVRSRSRPHRHQRPKARSYCGNHS